MSPRSRQYRMRLAKKLRYAAKIILEMVRASLLTGSPIAASAASRFVEVSVAVTLLGARPEASTTAPERGDHYSPLESQIVAALATAPGRLQGKEVAKALGMKYTGKVAVLLQNLELKGALVRDARGYGLGTTMHGGPQ